MECTQRLESTQICCEIQTEKSCPDQIGFLGICGEQYPIVKGPNKIGRDPQTCNIVLNLNSISRQHAVINVLGPKKYMLMDLGSANKTKLIDKCLQPYIPYPLTNGDTVQFGDIFGIFRLLDEEDDLPTTQALDIPETPIANKYSSKLASATTIPESPEVSDKEESFVGASQSIKDHKFKSPSSKFIKCSGKTISIQPIGTNKIDNIYWNSSKKSRSLDLSLENSRDSLNVSAGTDTKETVIENNIDIHEAETQLPFVNEIVDIHSANTQIPTGNLASSTRYTSETQIPLADNLPEVCKINEPFDMECDFFSANKENENIIYNAETQLIVCPIEKPEDMKAPILSEGQPSSCAPKNGVSILPEEEILFDEMDSQSFLEDFSSQPLLLPEPNVSTDTIGPKSSKINSSTSKGTDSPEIALKPKKRVNRIKSDSSTDCEDIEILPTQKEITTLLLPEPNVSTDTISPKSSKINVTTSNGTDLPEIALKPKKRVNRIKSDSSTDCEDIEILPTQKEITTLLLPEPNVSTDTISPKSSKINVTTSNGTDLPEIAVKPKKRVNCIKSDSSTDCEDEVKIDTNKNKTVNFQEDIHILPTQIIPNIEDDLTDCEDNVINDQDNTSNTKIFNKKVNNNIDDQQIDMKNKIPIEIQQTIKNVSNVNFEDLQTQIIKKPNEDNIEDLPTQIIPEQMHVKKELQKSMTEVVITQNFDEVDNEDVLTQVIPELPSKKPMPKTSIETIIVEEVESPFKVPTQSPRKTRRKDLLHITTPKKHSSKSFSSKEEEVNYYAATQDILNDLSSQKIKEIPQTNVSDALATVNLPPDSNVNKSVADYVSRLSSKEITEVVVGAQVQTKVPQRVPSDPSDVEETPKKVKPLKFMETDLPDSQEIKANVNTHSRNSNTEDCSDTEPENNSEECTPILFRNKKRLKKKVEETKVDLTKRFDELPARVSTRVRKPTAKALSSCMDTKLNNNKLWSNQENEVDSEIIEENLTRLRNRIKKKLPSDSKRNDHISDTDSKYIVNKDDAKKDKIKNQDDAIVNQEYNKNEKSRGKRRNSRNKEDECSHHKPKRTQKIKINEIKETHTAKTIGTITQQSKIETTLEKDKVEEKDSKLHEIKENKVKIIGTKIQQKKIVTTLDKDKVKEKDSKSHEIKEDKIKIVGKRSRALRTNEKHKSSRENSKSPEVVETRRSARQKTVKEKEPLKPKSILKESRSNDQSTVYNISSESSIDSPKGLKRSAERESDVSRSKRTCNKNQSNSSFLRTTPARSVRAPRVLFTAFPEPVIKDVSSKLNKLGAVVVSEVMACTVVVTPSVKRTFKLLCAAALGRPIVGPNWVQACHDTNIIVDPWLYLLKDEIAEKRFQFSLQRTLTGKRNFLKGYNVSCTPNVKPSESEMKVIVQCSGGTWFAKGPRWVCVSCVGDKELWSELSKKGAIIVGAEFILSGVLRQQVDIEGNLLKHKYLQRCVSFIQPRYDRYTTTSAQCVHTLIVFH